MNSLIYLDTVPHRVAQVNLKFVILLLQSPEHAGYKSATMLALHSFKHNATWNL